MSKTYTVTGDPTPLARPRFGGGKVWDSQKSIKFSIERILALQHGTLPMYKGPVFLQVSFFMPIPKRRKNIEGLPHVSRPDLSNLIKFIEDVGTGILYDDDCIIAGIMARKLYDKDPRTELKIIPFESIIWPIEPIAVVTTITEHPVAPLKL